MPRSTLTYGTGSEANYGSVRSAKPVKLGKRVHRDRETESSARMITLQAYLCLRSLSFLSLPERVRLFRSLHPSPPFFRLRSTRLPIVRAIFTVDRRRSGELVRKLGQLSSKRALGQTQSTAAGTSRLAESANHA